MHDHANRSQCCTRPAPRAAAAAALCIMIVLAAEALRVQPDDVTIYEAAGGEHLMVSLSSAPLAAVTVSAMANPEAPGADRLVLHPATLVFTPQQWGTHQHLLVDVVDDAYAHPTVTMPLRFSAASSDTGHVVPADDSNAPAVLVTLVDKDSAGVFIDRASVTVTEGGAASGINMVLTSRPAHAVTVRMVPGDQVSVTPAAVVFQPDLWMVAQLFHVIAIDDDVAEGLHADGVTLMTSSQDGTYHTMNGLPVLAVTVLDNDHAGIVVQPVALAAWKGRFTASSSLNVTLTSRPRAPVTVQLMEAATEVVHDPLALMFAPSEWRFAHSMALSTRGDMIARPPRQLVFRLASSSADGMYQDLRTDAVSMTVLDDTPTGFRYNVTTHTPVTLLEGTTVCISATMLSKPAAPLHITVLAPARLRVEPAVLLVAPQEWELTHALSVHYPDDAVAWPNEDAVLNLTIVALGHDPILHGRTFRGPVLRLRDKDVAGATAHVEGATVTEGAAAVALFRLRLHSQPFHAVQPRLTGCDRTVLTHCAVHGDPDSCAIQPTQWSQDHIVYASVPRDWVVEPMRTCSISLSLQSSDRAYTLPSITDSMVLLIDGDVVGIDPQPAALVVAEGGTATASVTLRVRPHGAVTVSVTIGVGSPLTVSTAALSFTADSFLNPQALIVSAPADKVAQGNRTVTLALVPHSLDDTRYSPASAASTLPVIIVDSNVAGVVLHSSKPDILEDRAHTLSVNLLAASLDSTTMQLTAAPAAHCSVQPGSITVPAGATSASVTVTTSAQPYVVQNVTCTFAAVVTAGHALFQGCAAQLAIPRRDAHAALPTATPGSFMLQERDATGQNVTLSLLGQPKHSVSVHLWLSSPCGHSGAAIVAHPAVLELQPHEWAAGRTARVVALDDDVAYGNVTCLVTCQLESMDALFHGTTVPHCLTVQVVDDDEPGLALHWKRGTATRGRRPAVVDLSLTSQPLADVTVMLQPPDCDCAHLSPATIVFSPNAWGQPASVTVELHAVQCRTPLALPVGGRASSDDANYAALIERLAPRSALLVTLAEAPEFSVQWAHPSPPSSVTEGSGLQLCINVSLPPLDADVLVTVRFSSNSSRLQPILAVEAMLRSGRVHRRCINATVPHDDHLQPDELVMLAVDLASSHACLDGLRATAITVIRDRARRSQLLLLSPPALNMTEGDTSMVNAALAATPKHTVAAAVTVSDSAQLQVLLGSTLTYPAAAWFELQPVVIHAVDDDVARPPQVLHVEFDLISADNDFTGLRIRLPVHVIDNDVPGVLLSRSHLLLVERGSPQRISLKLATRPLADVTIGVRTPGFVNAEPSVIVMAPHDRAVPHEFIFSAVADNVATGNLSFTLSFNVSSSDPVHDALGHHVVNGTMVDTDVVGLHLSLPRLALVEGVVSRALNVTLRTIPTAAAVTVQLLPTAFRVQVTPNTLVFTPGTWDQPQSVQATALWDQRATGTLQYQLRFALRSADASYDALSVPNLRVDVADVDVADIDVAPSLLQLTEAGGNRSVTVRLTSMPEAAVTVRVQLPAVTRLRAFPSSLAFSTLNWHQPATMQLEAVHDYIAWPPRMVKVSAVATGSAASYQDVAAVLLVNITDIDVAGAAVVPALASIPEGAEVRFKLWFASHPQAPISLRVREAVHGQVDAAHERVAVSRSDAVVATSGPNATMAFWLHHVDDNVQHENDTITIALELQSNDAQYRGIRALVTLTLLDNDRAALQLIPSHAMLTEEQGASSSVKLRVELATQPRQPVMLSAAWDPAVLLATPVALHVTPSAWRLNHTFVLRALDNSRIEGTVRSHFRVTAGSDDRFYDALVTQSSLDIIDNDFAAVLLALAPGSLVHRPGCDSTRNTTSTLPPACSADQDLWGRDSISLPLVKGGDPATMVLALSATPAAPVAVQLHAAAPHEDLLHVSPSATLLLTPDEWNVAQLLSIGVQPDDVAHPERRVRLLATCTSTDPHFHSTMPLRNVTATITDTMAPGVVPFPDTITLLEGHASTYHLRLLSRPRHNVTIAPRPDSSDLKPMYSVVLVEPAAWSLAAPLHMLAVDDDIVTGDRQVRVAHTAASGDEAYDAIAVPGVVVHIVEDDVASLQINASTLHCEEGGSPMPLGLRITSRPVAAVSVLLQSPTARLSVEPESIVILPEHWREKQVVWIGAVNDDIDEDDQAFNVSVSVTSPDEHYGRLPAMHVVAWFVDNDAAGLVAGPVALEVAEGGLPASFSISLTTRPLSSVTIAPTSPDSQLLCTPASGTITAATYEAGTQFNLAAMDDSFRELVQHFIVTAVAQSDDPKYAGQRVRLAVRVDDNDEAGVLAVAANGTMHEAGAAVAVTVQLRSRPLGPVRVVAHQSPRLAAAPPSMVIQEHQWREAHTMLLSVVDDDVARPVAHELVALQCDSSDVFYANETAAALRFAVIDKDKAGVVAILPHGGNVTECEEGASWCAYMLRLASEPLHAVYITVLLDAHGTVKPSDGVCLDADNWRAGIAVHVWFPRDHVDRGDSFDVVASHACSSEDSMYDTLGCDSVRVLLRVRDADVSGLEVQAWPLVLQEGSSFSIPVALTSTPSAAVSVTAAVQCEDRRSITVSPTEATSIEPQQWATPTTWMLSYLQDPLLRPRGECNVTFRTTSADPRFHWQHAAPTLHQGLRAGEGVADALVVVGLGCARLLAEDSTVAAISFSTEGSTGTGVDCAAREGELGCTVRFALTAVPASSESDVPSGFVRIELRRVGDGGAPPMHWHPGAVQINGTVPPHTWSGPLQISATSDDIAWPAAPVEFALSVASSHPAFHGMPVVVHPSSSIRVLRVDRNTAGAVANATLGVLDEGCDLSSSTVEVWLTSEPLQGVSVLLEPHARVSFSPASVVFTPLNWNVAGAIEVTAVDDDVAYSPGDAVHINAQLFSADSQYTGRKLLVTLSVRDNDVAQLRFNSLVDRLIEGATEDFASFRLATRPRRDVLISLSSSHTLVRVTPQLLDLAAWLPPTPRTVFLHATASPEYWGEVNVTVCATASSDDSAYHGARSCLHVTYVDGDTAGMLASGPPLAHLNRGDHNVAAQYEIRTLSAPHADVAVELFATHSANIVFSVNELLFPRGQASNTSVRVRCSALPLPPVTEGVIYAVATSTDPHYMHVFDVAHYKLLDVGMDYEQFDVTPPPRVVAASMDAYAILVRVVFDRALVVDGAYGSPALPCSAILQPSPARWGDDCRALALGNELLLHMPPTTVWPLPPLPDCPSGLHLRPGPVRATPTAVLAAADCVGHINVSVSSAAAGVRISGPSVMRQGEVAIFDIAQSWLPRTAAWNVTWTMLHWSLAGKLMHVDNFTRAWHCLITATVSGTLNVSVAIHSNAGSQQHGAWREVQVIAEEGGAVGFTPASGSMVHHGDSVRISLTTLAPPGITLTSAHCLLRGALQEEQHGLELVLGIIRPGNAPVLASCSVALRRGHAESVVRIVGHWEVAKANWLRVRPSSAGAVMGHALQFTAAVPLGLKGSVVWIIRRGLPGALSSAPDMLIPAAPTGGSVHVTLNTQDMQAGTYAVAALTSSTGWVEPAAEAWALATVLRNGSLSCATKQVEVRLRSKLWLPGEPLLLGLNGGHCRGKWTVRMLIGEETVGFGTAPALLRAQALPSGGLLLSPAPAWVTQPRFKFSLLVGEMVTLSVMVQAASAPRAGYLIAQPLEGELAGTHFNVAALGWHDSSVDALPLRFQFRAHCAAGLLELSDTPQSSPSLTTPLTSPTLLELLVSPNAMPVPVEFHVTVYNQFGASATNQGSPAIVSVHLPAQQGHGANATLSPEWAVAAPSMDSQALDTLAIRAALACAQRVASDSVLQLSHAIAGAVSQLLPAAARPSRLLPAATTSLKLTHSPECGSAEPSVLRTTHQQRLAVLAQAAQIAVNALQHSEDGTVSLELVQHMLDLATRTLPPFDAWHPAQPRAGARALFQRPSLPMAHAVDHLRLLANMSALLGSAPWSSVSLIAGSDAVALSWPSTGTAIEVDVTVPGLAGRVRARTTAGAGAGAAMWPVTNTTMLAAIYSLQEGPPLELLITCRPVADSRACFAYADGGWTSRGIILSQHGALCGCAVAHNAGQPAVLLIAEAERPVAVDISSPRPLSAAAIPIAAKQAFNSSVLVAAAGMLLALCAWAVVAAGMDQRGCVARHSALRTLFTTYGSLQPLAQAASKRVPPGSAFRTLLLRDHILLSPFFAKGEWGAVMPRSERTIILLAGVSALFGGVAALVRLLAWLPEQHPWSLAVCLALTKYCASVVLRTLLQQQRHIPTHSADMLASAEPRNHRARQLHRPAMIRTGHWAGLRDSQVAARPVAPGAQRAILDDGYVDSLLSTMTGRSSAVANHGPRSAAAIADLLPARHRPKSPKQAWAAESLNVDSQARENRPVAAQTIRLARRPHNSWTTVLPPAAPGVLDNVGRRSTTIAPTEEADIDARTAPRPPHHRRSATAAGAIVIACGTVRLLAGLCLEVGVTLGALGGAALAALAVTTLVHGLGVLRLASVSSARGTHVGVMLSCGWQLVLAVLLGLAALGWGGWVPGVLQWLAWHAWSRAVQHGQQDDAGLRVLKSFQRQMECCDPRVGEPCVGEPRCEGRLLQLFQLAAGVEACIAACCCMLGVAALWARLSRGRRACVHRVVRVRGRPNAADVLSTHFRAVHGVVRLQRAFRQRQLERSTFRRVQFSAWEEQRALRRALRHLACACCWLVAAAGAFFFAEHALTFSGAEARLWLWLCCAVTGMEALVVEPGRLFMAIVWHYAL